MEGIKIKFNEEQFDLAVEEKSGNISVNILLNSKDGEGIFTLYVGGIDGNQSKKWLHQELKLGSKIEIEVNNIEKISEAGKTASLEVEKNELLVAQYIRLKEKLLNAGLINSGE